MAPAAREDRRYDGPGGQVGHDDRAAWGGPSHRGQPADPGRANPAAPLDRSSSRAYGAQERHAGRDERYDGHRRDQNDPYLTGGYVTGEDGHDDGRFGDGDPYRGERHDSDRYDSARYDAPHRSDGRRHGSDQYGDDQDDDPYGHDRHGDDRYGGDPQGGRGRRGVGWPSDHADTPAARRGGGAPGAQAGYGGREPVPVPDPYGEPGPHGRAGPYGEADPYGEAGPYGATAMHGGDRAPSAHSYGAAPVGRGRAPQGAPAAHDTRARRPGAAGRYSAGGFDTDRVDTPVPFAAPAPRAQPAPRSGPPPRSSDSLLPYVAFVVVIAVLAGVAGYALNRLVGPAHGNRTAPARASASPSAPATPTVTVGPSDPGAGGGGAGGGLTALTAQQVAGRLAETGLPMRTTVVYTAATDPDHLLGTVGGYWSRLAFSDSRVGANEVAGAPLGAIERGGSVEVWPDATTARRRAHSLLTVTEQNPLVTEYVYTRGSVVLRVSLVLTQQQAAGYQSALASISS